MRLSRNCRDHVLAVVLVCLTAVAFADEDTGWSNNNYVPPREWKESTVDLPRWPEQDDLLEVSIGRGGDPFHYYIDPESISISDDRVVHYVLVIISSAGAWNTSFEGILCSKGEYRRYAYGSGRQWTPLAGSGWQRIIDDGKYSYRDTLYQDYLCDPGGPNPDVSGILRRIRYQRDSFPGD
ncbi:MAG: CNP1-like family protein [Thiohalobacterales bacterium]